MARTRAVYVHVDSASRLTLMLSPSLILLHSPPPFKSQAGLQAKTGTPSYTVLSNRLQSVVAVLDSYNCSCMANCAANFAAICFQLTMIAVTSSQHGQKTCTTVHTLHAYACAWLVKLPHLLGEQHP